jgi:hypothetical protein
LTFAQGDIVRGVNAKGRYVDGQVVRVTPTRLLVAFEDVRIGSKTASWNRREVWVSKESAEKRGHSDKDLANEGGAGFIRALTGKAPKGGV